MEREKGEWRPIETAPRIDGRAVLLKHGQWAPYHGYWRDGQWCPIEYAGSWHPTHWMPLPEPPK